MKKVINGLILIATFILELLPNSLVMYFAIFNESGEVIKTPTYQSYFSFTAFSYGDFLPLIIAVITIISIALFTFCTFKPNEKLEMLVAYLEIAITIMSLMRLILGFGLTWISYIIMFLPLIAFLLKIFNNSNLKKI